MKECEKYRQFCSISLDSELSREEKKELNAHLDTCPECAKYLEDLRYMKTAWDGLKEPLPDEMHKKIMQSVYNENKRQKKRTWYTRPSSVATTIMAAAACVVLVLSGTLADILSGNMGAYDNVNVQGQIQTEDKQTKNEQPVENQPETAVTEQKTRAVPAPSEEQEPEIQNEVQPKAKTEENSGIAPANIVPQKESEEPQTYANSEGRSVVSQAHVSQAQSQPVEVPTWLQTQEFTFCCVALGGDELPMLETAQLQESFENTHYFYVSSSISDFDKDMKLLQENGFQTAMRDDIGVKLSESADKGLLIVFLN